MNSINKLFKEKLVIINIGLSSFAEDLEKQDVKVLHTDWHPPASGNVELLDILDNLEYNKIEIANKKVMEIIQNGQPILVGLGIAKDIMPNFTPKTILHAGPPITWDRMCGPVRGAVMGALVLEGLAKDYDEAIELAASGEIDFSPCHHYNAVGPMAGIVSASMPVWIIKNKTYGNYSYCTLNEGLGKVLRFGAYGDDIIKHLKWMRDELYPLLKAALEIKGEKGEIDLKILIAQALQMGDECHNRNKALTSLFYREIAPAIVKTDFSIEEKVRVLEFINSNDHFTLNLSMPACKSIMGAAEWIENSTIITTMTRNGTDFGIRVAGLEEKWFVSPAPMVKGLYFPGYTEKDAAADLGDSVITETCGIGGFAMATAPAIVGFVGGKPEDAIHYTEMMYQITSEKNKIFQIPTFAYRGTPTGIDIRKVIESGILPIINTGIAHKDPGIGQVGAGLVRPPMSCFEQALREFGAREEKEERELDTD